MDFLRNAAGLLIVLAILAPVIGYYPITFLIAWRQAASAQSWEPTRCSARCEMRQQKDWRGRLPKRKSYDYGIYYGFKSRLERPLISNLEVEMPNTKRPVRDAKTSDLEWRKQLEEFREKSQAERAEIKKRDEERKEKFRLESNVYEKEQEKFSRWREDFSVFQIAGWRYWGDYGWEQVCGRLGHDGKKIEADCFIDPSDPENAVLVRELRLDWLWTTLLVLNWILLFGFIYLSFRIFIHRRNKPKSSDSLFNA